MTSTSYVSLPTNTRLPNIVRSLPILLLLGDIFGLLICLAIAQWLRLDQPLHWLNPLPYTFVCMILAAFYLADAYHPDRQISGLRAPARIIICSIAIAFFISALIYLSGIAQNNPVTWRSVFLPSLGIFTIWAIILRVLAVRWVRSHALKSRWLILGGGDNAIKFAQKLLGLNPLGKLTLLAEENQKTIDLPKRNLSYQGSLSELSQWSQESWSGVIVTAQINFSTSQAQQLMQMRLRGIPVYTLPDVYETFWYKLPSSLLQDKWLAFSDGFNLMPGYFSMKLKRAVDIILILFLLVLVAPLLLLVALLVRLDSPGPVLYSQQRSGLHGKPFRVYKFRSMYQDAEKLGAQWASQRDPRITRVGYWLRLLRIDELPQIWNVLRGEMSLIGPRPERPEFDVKLKEAIPYYEVRYLVKPGITGWAQVMYPYGASIEDAYEKLSYDLYYIKNYSIWLDLAIAFKTIRVVLLGKGR
ncbi:MAG: sugar transferase [Nostoc sp. EfeVER01]|uniref:sugar transferase n=1 Tax=unclassified Nostoc TaxID=2593658 RepID=UPI002AD55D97|nr:MULTISPECIES: sugar transferase [unclassified Nostoc]MDZ7945857.1 sugar transferase [Nostoc sp. EfeVER01]MDZ7990622.1 sugar transferase [Nostoc sp. EspVER01]